MTRFEQRELRAATQGVIALCGLILLGITLVAMFLPKPNGSPSAATSLRIRPLASRSADGMPVETMPSVTSPEAKTRRAGRKRAALQKPLLKRTAIKRTVSFNGSSPSPHPSDARSQWISTLTSRPGPERRQTHNAWKPGRLAIVIDDIGHNLDILRRFLSLEGPLTFAILPTVAHTREAAGLIGGRGIEYIIHLPMQPFDYPGQNPGPLPLLLTQSLQETAARVRTYLDRLPGAVGASNHMGSAYTFDEDRMRVVQTILAERDKYFLNSRTSAARVPRDVARQWGYVYLERDVFLDHVQTEASIERYLRQAVRMAEVRGKAIAIGHPYPETFRVLQRRLSRLQHGKVRLVTLSELTALRNPPRLRPVQPVRSAGILPPAR